MEPIIYTPIGIVRSPFTSERGMPIQAVAAPEVAGRIELEPIYAPGLQDLDGFSHILVLCHLHRVQGASLTVTPFLDDQPHGVFATRSPKRPNSIGLSTVRLLRVEGHILHIAGVDLLDGTPVLDIKPYVPLFDDRADARIGWFAARIHNVHTTRADDRFR